MGRAMGKKMHTHPLKPQQWYVGRVHFAEQVVPTQHAVHAANQRVDLQAESDVDGGARQLLTSIP